MLRQSEIMHEVAEIMILASNGEFDELVLEVEVNISGGSVTSKCRQITNGKVEYLSFWEVDPNADLEEMGFELYEEMKNHTGGKLKKYTVTIDKEGTARARFEYRDRTET